MVYGFRCLCLTNIYIYSIYLQFHYMRLNTVTWGLKQNGNRNEIQSDDWYFLKGKQLFCCVEHFNLLRFLSKFWFCWHRFYRKIYISFLCRSPRFTIIQYHLLIFDCENWFNVFLKLIKAKMVKWRCWAQVRNYECNVVWWWWNIIDVRIVNDVYLAVEILII